MSRSHYVCGVVTACAVAAATLVPHAEQQPAAPATQKPGAIPLPGEALLAPPPMPAILKQYQSIPAERLKNPPDGDWPMIRRTYDGWGYSPLNQIDTDNVKRLQPAWIFSTAQANGHEAPPMVGRDVTYTKGLNYVGAISTLYLYPGAKHIGEVQGWNVDTGKRVWTHTFASSANWGPILTTGGGLVFSGGTNDRMFRAFEAKNGKLLWETPTNSGIIGVPMSFAVDGRQYVAVQSGFGIDSRAMQARLNRAFPANIPKYRKGEPYGSSH